MVVRQSWPRSRWSEGSEIPFLDRGDRKGVAQDMRGHLLADVGAIDRARHELLDGPLADAERVVHGTVPFEQGLHPIGEGNHEAFDLGALGTALALDHQAVSMPIEVVFREARQLRDTKARVEERPDQELFQVRLAGIGQVVGLVLGKRFAFVSVGHASRIGDVRLLPRWQPRDAFSPRAGTNNQGVTERCRQGRSRFRMDDDSYI